MGIGSFKILRADGIGHTLHCGRGITGVVDEVALSEGNESQHSGGQQCQNHQHRKQTSHLFEFYGQCRKQQSYHRST